MSNNPIGIFDSGVGGLTVAKAIKELLPNEKIIYFGDTLHLPYGEKSSQSIVRYSKQITDFLLSQNCKAIVIACNSASAHAFDTVRGIAPSDVPIINVIDPMAEFTRDNFSAKKVGVIGTKATVRSGVYQNRLAGLNLVAIETPLLASMVEEGFINNDISKSVIKEYLNKPVLNGIDALVLGCTHYPILKKDILNFYKGRVDILDSSQIVATELQKQLRNLNLLNENSNNEADKFYVSDYTSFFEKITSIFFGNEIHLEELKIT
ncbi:MAG: glutamate racemase [Salibacteraceae bacterium]